MINITLRHGFNTVTTSVESGTSINDLVDQFSGALKLPENYRALVNGSAVEGSSTVYDGSTVVFEKRASDKGI